MARRLERRLGLGWRLGMALGLGRLELGLGMGLLRLGLGMGFRLGVGVVGSGFVRMGALLGLARVLLQPMAR